MEKYGSMAAPSSIPAWRIPWTEEPGRLQSIGSQRVRHDWSDFACMNRKSKHRHTIWSSNSTFINRYIPKRWRRQWHPTPVLLPGKSHGRRSLIGCMQSSGVAKSRTRLSDFTFTFHFHALEKEMAAHSCTLAWRIPGMGEPGWLPSMESHRVGHDWSDLAAAAAGLLEGLSHLIHVKILEQFT